MNTKNSKTNEPNRFKYYLIELSQLIITISLKYHHPL